MSLPTRSEVISAFQKDNQINSSFQTDIKDILLQTSPNLVLNYNDELTLAANMCYDFINALSPTHPFTVGQEMLHLQPAQYKQLPIKVTPPTEPAVRQILDDVRTKLNHGENPNGYTEVRPQNSRIIPPTHGETPLLRSQSRTAIRPSLPSDNTLQNIPPEMINAHFIDPTDIQQSSSLVGHTDITSQQTITNQQNITSSTQLLENQNTDTLISSSTTLGNNNNNNNIHHVATTTNDTIPHININSPQSDLSPTSAVTPLTTTDITPTIVSPITPTIYTKLALSTLTHLPGYVQAKLLNHREQLIQQQIQNGVSEPTDDLIIPSNAGFFRKLWLYIKYYGFYKLPLKILEWKDFLDQNLYSRWFLIYGVYINLVHRVLKITYVRMTNSPYRKSSNPIETFERYFLASMNRLFLGITAARVFYYVFLQKTTGLHYVYNFIRFKLKIATILLCKLFLRLKYCFFNPTSKTSTINHNNELATSNPIPIQEAIEDDLKQTFCPDIYAASLNTTEFDPSQYLSTFPAAGGQHQHDDAKNKTTTTQYTSFYQQITPHERHKIRKRLFRYELNLLSAVGKSLDDLRDEAPERPADWDMYEYHIADDEVNNNNGANDNIISAYHFSLSSNTDGWSTDMPSSASDNDTNGDNIGSSDPFEGLGNGYDEVEDYICSARKNKRLFAHLVMPQNTTVKTNNDSNNNNHIISTSDNNVIVNNSSVLNHEEDEEDDEEEGDDDDLIDVFDNSNIKPNSSHLPSNTNVQPVLLRTKCSICFGKAKSTTSTLCGHLYCWNCILPFIEAKKECPTCRTQCLPSQLLRLFQFQ